MRILLAGSTSIPNPNGGGISTYVAILQRELQRLGHEVDILFQDRRRLKYHMPNNGRSLIKRKVKKLISAKLKSFYMKKRLKIRPSIMALEKERYCFEAAAAYFGLNNYDVIHAQDVLCSRAIRRVKPKHVPLVLTSHGDFIIGKGKYSYLSEYHGALSSDHMIVASEWLKNRFVKKFGVPANHISVIPNGLDISSFLTRLGEPIEKSPNDKKIILCTARLAEIKGHKYLLRALRKLKKVRVDWECWLAGDGNMKKKLEAQCKKLDVQKQVRFLGKRNDIPKLLNRSDIFVLSSLQENCPYAVIEAQIAGKPVVVSNAGGIPELVNHKVTGLLSPAGKSTDLYKNLKLILEDSSLRTTLADNGKQQALEHGSLDQMLTFTLEIYERVRRSTNNLALD